MKNIAVLFGGVSVEHEVSVITGMQVVENMDKTKYNPIPVLVTKDGKFLSGDAIKDFGNIKRNKLEDAKEVFFKPVRGDFNLYTEEEQGGGLFSKKTSGVVVFEKIDAVFVALHGTFGEDGAVQGILQFIGIPYTGCAVNAAAVGMDKVIMKDVFKSQNIPMTDYSYFYRDFYKFDDVKAEASRIGYPVFVKPANLGSSVGISKAKDEAELKEAVEIAMNYDRKIIVEKSVEKPREINCAVMGYEDDLQTSLTEEPITWEDFLTYDDKYKSGGKGSKSVGMKNQKKNLPANIPDEMTEEIKRLAKLAFRSIDAMGVARIDFLVDENEKVYVNEINTLPGSIAFYLFEPMGISFKELIDRQIDLAFRRSNEFGKNIYSYDTDLFNSTSYGAKL